MTSSHTDRAEAELSEEEGNAVAVQIAFDSVIV